MTDGRLALVFDDGFAADFELLRPVLSDLDAPASLAIVPAWLGEPDHLDPAQLDALDDEGWEVLSHGRSHRYLQSHHLAADVAPGDERVRLDSGHVFPGEDHAVYPGDAYELVDPATAERCTVAGKSRADGDPVVMLAEPVSGSFAAGESVLRLTEGTLRDELVGVREDFADLGYDPDGFVFPYDGAGSRAWSLAAAAYGALPNAAVRSLPNPPGTPDAALRRYYLETTHMTRPDLGAYLDAVADCGGLGVLGGHTAWESVTAERVRWVVEAARERDVAVTTVSDAVAGED